jgi:ribosomal protein S18 acetylase RimI-like enzyme
MAIEIVAATRPEELAPLADRLISVYRDTFSGPPFAEGEGGAERFAESLPRHVRREGFRCAVALEGGRALGFAYGHTNEPGQWWYEQVAPALTAGQIDRWFRGAFVVVTLAVTPLARGRGIGGRLHDELLAAPSHKTAVLSTRQEESAAMRLYRGRGWQELARGVLFPHSDTPNVIMGLDLPAAR